MHTQLDPSDPTTLTDAEAAHLAVRPTKAQVVELLQELRTERERTGAAQFNHTTAMMDLRTSEDLRKEVRAQLDGFDPEARLVADMEVAVAAYEAALRAADEAASRNRGGYAQVSTGYHHGDQQPRRPALDSPLGRALLHVAARHGVAIEAITEYPDPRPEQQLVSVPRHVADQLQQVPQEAWR